MTTVLRRGAGALALALLAATLSACIVEERPASRWCYYHPGACR